MTWLRRSFKLLPAFIFAGAAVWAQELSDEQREKAAKLPEILGELGIAAGSQVADVGAGTGFYTARLAKAVGTTGRVYAVDIDDKYAIPELKKLVEKQSLTNVTVIHSTPDDPQLPDGRLDAVLIVNAYHEIVPYAEMLRHILAALKPGGRLVVVENMPYKTRSRARAFQTKNHRLAPEVAEPEFRAAGFEIVSRREDFIDPPDEEESRWMIVCRRQR
jgi:predicted methyltransferase